MGPTRLPTTRRALAVVAAVAVGALAAVILGEYTFVGLTPWVAGVVVPVAVAEAAALAGGRRARWRWPLAAVVGGAALWWGVWLSTGRGLDPWPSGGWISLGVGVAVPLLAAARLGAS